MTDFVTVTKYGEPRLRILREGLAEHARLGWSLVESEPEKVGEAVTVPLPKQEDPSSSSDADQELGSTSPGTKPERRPRT